MIKRTSTIVCAIPVSGAVALSGQAPAFADDVPGTQADSVSQDAVPTSAGSSDDPGDTETSDPGYVLDTTDPVEPGSAELALDPGEGPAAVPGRVSVASTAVAAGDPSQPGGAVTWGACGVTTSSTKTVRTFTNRYRASDAGRFLRGGSSVLYCGDDNYGYRHIKLRHESQFENLTFMTNENWRDLADRMIAGTLVDPDDTTYTSKNDTFTYCRIFFFIDLRSHRVVSHSYPRVVVSASNGKVITAYPNSVVCPHSW